MFVSKIDRQDKSLTSQVRDQARHCPLTRRYFQPWVIFSQVSLYVYVEFVYVQKYVI